MSPAPELSVFQEDVGTFDVSPEIRETMHAVDDTTKIMRVFIPSCFF